MKAQHIHDADLRNDSPKEVRPLVTAGSHQQAAIRASLHDNQMTLFSWAATKVVTTMLTPVRVRTAMTVTLHRGSDNGSVSDILDRDEMVMVQASLYFQSSLLGS